MDKRATVFTLLLAASLTVGCGLNDDTPPYTPATPDGGSQPDTTPSGPSNLDQIDSWIRSGQLPADPQEQPKNTQATSPNQPISTATCQAVYHTSGRFIADNYVAFNPNAQSMWAGALVGTKGLANTGILNAIAAARAPMQLVVTGAAQTTSGNPLPTQVFTMPVASLANYEIGRRAAIGAGFQPAAVWEYSETEFHNFQQAMTDLNINASWVTGSAAASLDIGSSHATTKLMIEFKQRYYDVIASAPAKPSDVFDPSQRLDDLAAQAGEEPIGYLASVTYGRHIIMTVESNADISTLRAALNANQHFVSGSVGVAGSVDLQNVINQANIKIYTVGDDPANSLQVIAAADKVAAMRNAVGGRPPSDSLVLYGVPISYRVNYLKNNAVAKIGLAEDFDTTVDSARPQADFVSAALVCCSESQCGNNDQSKSLTAHPPAGCEFVGTPEMVNEDTHGDASYGWSAQPTAQQMASSCWSSHHSFGTSGYTRTHMHARMVCSCQ